MPKAERGSVKDIANRMKAKGLQKLKFYCQMCQKQCRDANGFKCHIQSESHLRQMKIFGDNASGYLKQYSNEFEKVFLTTLRMRHGTKKVNANNVYQEVIADKQHIHMNATIWTTLTDFVQYLGKSKKCIVEENHSDGTGGWTISYIERDVGILARREAQQKREAADKRAEEALLERMKIQRIEAAKALEVATNGGNGLTRVEATSILGGDNKQPVKIVGLASKTKNKKNQNITASVSGKGGAAKAAFGDDDDEEEVENDAETSSVPTKLRTKHSTTDNVKRVMDETRKNAHSDLDTDTATRKRRHGTNATYTQDAPANIGYKRTKQEGKPTKSKHKHHDSDGFDTRKSRNEFEEDTRRNEKCWLYRDIIVRIIHKTLEGGKYFRKKAVVDRVLGEGFVAEVEVLGDDEGSGDVLRLDQSHLETVVPKLGGGKKPSREKAHKVRILRGRFRGKKAIIESLDKSRYSACLVLYSKRARDGGGDHDDAEHRALRDVPYEHFSQLA